MITQLHKSIRGFITAASLFANLGFVALANAQTSANTAPSENATDPPHILATMPDNGATDVDPATKEITVTFDRDMGGGMSWTGGGPDYPKSPDDAKAQWRDKRTCVLPVKLQPGHSYRIGINSMSYKNFCGVNGIPVSPKVISFRTSGTAVEPKAPLIVGLTPRNGALDVSPSLTELRVTFNLPMSSGFSWTGGGPNFPTIPEGRKPFWAKDGKTCVLPVELKPGWTYELGFNSQSYKGFQSEDGVPLSPVKYTFKTSATP